MYGHTEHTYPPSLKLRVMPCFCRTKRHSGWLCLGGRVGRRAEYVLATQPCAYVLYDADAWDFFLDAEEVSAFTCTPAFHMLVSAPFRMMREKIVHNDPQGRLPRAPVKFSESPPYTRRNKTQKVRMQNDLTTMCALIEHKDGILGIPHRPPVQLSGNMFNQPGSSPPRLTPMPWQMIFEQLNAPMPLYHTLPSFAKAWMGMPLLRSPWHCCAGYLACL